MILVHRRQRPYLWIAGLLVAIEAGFWIAGLWTGNQGRLRMWAVTSAGFWPGLLGDWQSNFRLQPVTMFATYWLIHAGPLHLLGNIAMIAWFADRMGADLRCRESLEIWFGSVLGGAVAFGALSQSISPMIGASGGVFGLLGAYVTLRHGEWRRDFGHRSAILRTGLICGAIVALSLVDYVMRNAVLAWQAHLGGFLTGAALTWTLVPAAPRDP